jgi:transcriptional regulator with PAS, ATPase and Fis domain
LYSRPPSQMAHASSPFRSKTSETADVELFRPGESYRPYLILVGSARGAPNAARLHAIDEGTDIGRGRPKAGRNVRILALEDRSVSSSHARIARTTKGFQIVDMESRNGTFVDGRSVREQALREGAIVFFGGYASVFRLLTEDGVSAIHEELQEPFGPVPTASWMMATAIRKLRRLATTSESILLTGETGSGKEVYARAIHGASGRRGRFVGLNCAAIPTELVESELFGYVRGAHSQAAQAKRGLIEEADGGTLFLDELGDMPRGAQTKLLRFLQEREVLPLGGTQARRVDVRVLAATSSLDGSGGGPTVRQDLMSRLGAQPVQLPPLRERPEDIGTLVHHFARAGGPSFDNPAFLALCLHDWPGNVRELEKVVQEARILGQGEPTIDVRHLPSQIASRLTGPSDRTVRRRSPRPAPDRAALDALLVRHQGRVADVARTLDRRWAVVWRWMKNHSLDPDQYRAPR